MKRIVQAVATAAVVTFALPAFAQDAMPVEDPAAFAAMAASSNMFEIESSNLALENAQQEDVKSFAQMMVDDHTAAAEKMMTAAEADSVSVPQEMNEKHQGMLDELSAAGAEEFDGLYLDMQVQAHEEAVALFESYSEADTNLGTFAAETLPTLEEHLARVQELAQ